MSVATAMLIGFIYVIFVTRSNPAELVKKFFDGMGSGYGSIIGLIIAAGVFAAGLEAAAWFPASSTSLKILPKLPSSADPSVRTFSA